MLSKFKDFDFYRKIPKDLTESSAHGTVLSVCASVFMLILFVAELWAFLSLQMSTDIVIDPNTDSQLRVNFNITVLDIPCEYATIDVVDVLGTRSQNVTVNINKWQVDSDGIRRNYEGRNTKQKDLAHDTHHDLVLLHQNGMHAVPVDEGSFSSWLSKYEYVFVNYYAPWCVWCQRLEPVWEALAERITTDNLPISVIKVDCIANRNLCIQERIQAFPLLRFYRHGQPQPPDYRSDRTVDALMEFVNSRISQDEQLKLMSAEEQQQHIERKKEQDTEHPGCMLTGFLLVNRVPGNFHIEMRSKNHAINPPMANMSHVVNSLSFGPVLSKVKERKLKAIPKDYFSLDSTKVMDENFYVNEQLHQAYHHYIKVVPTNVEPSSRYSGANSILAYQMVQSSQMMTFSEDEVPDARFTYDLSPMSVNVKRKGKRWYEFITSMCALIGGTFTVVGLLSGVLNVLFKSKKL